MTYLRRNFGEQLWQQPFTPHGCRALRTAAARSNRVNAGDRTTTHSQAASNLAYVIFAFRNRITDFTETPYVRVDVTSSHSW